MTLLFHLFSPFFNKKYPAMKNIFWLPAKWLRLICLAILAIQAPANALAQSLDSLYLLVLQRNPELQAQTSMEASQRAGVRRAGLWGEPMLEAGIMGMNMGNGPEIRPGQVLLMQPLPKKGLRSLEKEAATQELAMATTATESSRRELFESFASQYFAWAELHLTLRSEQEQLRNLQAIRQLTNTKLENGSMSLDNLLRIDLELAMQEETLFAMEDRIRVAEAELSRLGADPAWLFPPDTIAAASWPFSKDSTWQMIESQHPALRNARLQEQYWQTRQTMAGKSALPGVSVGVGYNTMVLGHGRGEMLETMGSGQLMTSLNLPLRRDAYRAEQEQAQWQQQAATAQTTGLQWQLQAELETWLVALEEAQRKEGLYTRQRLLQQQRLSLLTVQYATNGTALEELILAEKDLLRYDLARQQARIRQHSAVAALRAMTGLLPGN